MDRYEEALERAKQGKPIDEVFPELKKSDDDIRKRIINILGNNTDAHEEGWAIYADEIAWLESQKEQKPAELERLAKLREMTHEIREAYERGIEVGKRIEQKPAEWSEEDEEMLDAMIDIVSNSLYEPLCPREGMLIWLKALRPHWKPSEEQMEALAWYSGNSGVPPTGDKAIKSLYNDLKKLM